MVSSHSKGIFDGRNFIIIDKFSKHLGKSNIRSFKDSDTFFFGDLQLSEDAVVLVEKSKYEQLLAQYPMLGEYNVILYEGDPKIAVEMYLASIGIISFEIGEHGFKNSNDNFNENLMYQLYSEYASKLKNTFGIISISHKASQEYTDDDVKSIVLWDYYEGLFFEYLFNKINMPKENSCILIEHFLKKDDIFECKNMLKQIIIEQIGLDRFKMIVDEFNAMILNQVKNNELEVNSVLFEKLNDKSNLK